MHIEPLEDPKEQTTLIPPSDDKDEGSSGSEENRSYGPNDLVKDEQSDSEFYDCPHAPRQRQCILEIDSRCYGP